MSTPYLGEIRIFSGSFAIKGFALCNGQLLPLSQNSALFSIIGTAYGGDGKTNFALPNFQGRVPINAGAGAGLSTRANGQMGGESSHALIASELPAHTHSLYGVNSATTPSPSATTLLGAPTDYPGYLATSANTVMNNGALASFVGGGQAHENTQPILALNFIIALSGIYPSRQ